MELQDYFILHDRFVVGLDLGLALKFTAARSVPDILAVEFLSAINMGATAKIREAMADD